MGQQQCCANIPEQHYYDASRRNGLANSELFYTEVQNAAYQKALMPRKHPMIVAIQERLSNYQYGKNRSSQSIASLRNINEQYDIDLNAKQFPSEPKKLNSYNVIYVGQWKNKVPHGRGQIYFADGSYYKGIIVRGMADVHGRYIDKKGWCYQGGICKQQSQGNGKFILFVQKTNTNSGSKIQLDQYYTYEGRWEADKPDGQGKQQWKSKEVIYQGQFVGGRKHGFGRYTNIKQQWSYQGSFNNNQICSSGKILYKNNQTYEGQILNGMKHGYGIYTWPDKTKYQGWYKNDLKNGSGVYTIKKVQKGEQITITFDGEWSNGRQVGKHRAGQFSTARGLIKESTITY